MDVKAAVLNKVMDYCKHFVDNKMPDIEKVRISWWPSCTGSPSCGVAELTARACATRSSGRRLLLCASALPACPSGCTTPF